MSIFEPQSEVFLRMDIQHILRSIDGANHALAAQLPIHDMQLYCAGFRSALQAVATAFDVQLDPMIRDVPLPKLVEGNHAGHI